MTQTPGQDPAHPPASPGAPAAGRACPHCGAALDPAARFCEGCGQAVTAGAAAPGSSAAAQAAIASTATGPTVAGEASPGDDLGHSPISAPTHLTPVAPAPPAGRRPCTACGGQVGPDLYCEQCGTKAPTERDHFREEPAGWVAGVCDRGIAHHRNEDAMALAATPVPGERAVLVVLDGVSSSIDSDVASLAGARAAREVLRQRLPQGMGTPESRAAAVAKAFGDTVVAANEAVVAATAPDSPNPASATFVAAVLEGRRLAFANVGDSRAYWLPDPGQPGEPVQLTVDDSGAQAQIEAGVPREQAETSTHAHAITKWLGRDSPDLTPRVGELELSGSGWVLVCSDGLWNYASEPTAIAEVVVREQEAGATDPAALALALVRFANDCGGRDNITATLARVDAPVA
ncbi:PP2C family serine/threonine-protein phosphatase [Nocardioides nanhaiensis]|uniref:PPM-type phosphatase domain-containing protein n=1 Tax=Nocardioides nanhaiensis TaxID=1476871 RepID=A0ABP8W592_9ACTN